MGKQTLDDGRSLSLLPASIFLLVAVLQLLDGFVVRLSKREFRSTEEEQIQQEIKQHLKAATLLSTPSTFAQAAKLRRMAAAKEKELLKIQEVNRRAKGVPCDLYARALMIMKVITYLVLSWWFWGVPVAAAPQQLLQPFGKVLSWRAGDPATGFIMVGIVPWLVLTTRISKFLCQKLSNVIH
uniref:Tail-anchored protein insertion receptor WRB n=1 Tax=Anthurium amnicola TaxID=1678845 RepID=A0A1D1YW17_9ARAE